MGWRRLCDVLPGDDDDIADAITAERSVIVLD
jgi:hypothetical protein